MLCGRTDCVELRPGLPPPSDHGRGGRRIMDSPVDGQRQELVDVISVVVKVGVELSYVWCVNVRRRQETPFSFPVYNFGLFSM